LRGHYNPAAIDDSFQKEFIKIHPSARPFKTIFFLQSDIDEFSKYETDLDDQLMNKDLTF
jgi:carboxyl-terminal processing protease